MVKQRSLQSQLRKMKASEIPSDMGLLPETLLMPTLRYRPSLFSSQFKKRLRLEWASFTQPFADLARFFYLTWWTAKKNPIDGKKPKTPLLLRDRYVIAQDLHRRLYTAIANDDSETIEKIACTGLKRQLQIRFDQRKAQKLPKEDLKIEYTGFNSPKMPWLIHALIPGPFKGVQIVADRYAALPVGEDASLRQIFARIRSVQTLDKNDGRGPRRVPKTEIVVFQQMKIDGVEDDWMIWGTTEPTMGAKLDEFLDAKQNSGQETAWSRMKDTLTGVATKQGQNPGL